MGLEATSGLGVDPERLSGAPPFQTSNLTPPPRSYSWKGPARNMRDGVQPSCPAPPEGSEPPGAGEAGPHLLRAGVGGGGARSRAHWGPCSPSPGLGCSPPLPALRTCGAPTGKCTPLAVPPATDTSSPVRPPDLGASPPCCKPTFRGAPRPIPGVSPRSPPPPFDAGSSLVRSPRPPLRG